MKTHSNLLLLLLLFLVGLTNPVASQNAPVTTCPNVSASGPGALPVPITVTGFTNIGAISLTLRYDYSVAHFVSGIPNSQLNTMAFGDSDLGNGMHQVNIGWFGPGKTLADGSIIFTLNFTYISGNSAITWYDDGGSCEYANGNYEVLNDIPTASYYINGIICGAIGDPGTITGPDTLCQGTQGVNYGIEPLENATGYNWTVPAGAEIINGQGTNVIIVDYASDAMSGNISVEGTNACGNGPSVSVYIAVYSLPLASAGPDQTINYGTSTDLSAATPGSENYAFHWSPEELLIDPDVQDPQTIILTTTTIFTLQVTNTNSGCVSYDEVTVFITGGPLSVNPIALPPSLCLGESSQLYANASGGSENYSYSWTCNPPGTPPWSSSLANPVVSPAVSTIYLLTVNDGFTNANGSTGIEVNDLPTATISGGDTLCGEGSMTTLTVDLTGTPPWDFIWNISSPFGNTSVFVFDQQTSPYNIFANESGTYTVTYVEDQYCNGLTFGTARVDVFPVPAAPQISLNGMVLSSDHCCGNQWYLNGDLIPGANSQQYTASESGAYFDIVTLNGCSSEPSDTLDVIVGINEIERNTMTLYPNPARDKVSLTVSGMEGDYLDIFMINLEGTILFKNNFYRQTNNQEITIDLTAFQNGIYFLRVCTQKSQLIEKLIIMRP